MLKLPNGKIKFLGLSSQNWMERIYDEIMAESRFVERKDFKPLQIKTSPSKKIKDDPIQLIIDQFKEKIAEQGYDYEDESLWGIRTDP